MGVHLCMDFFFFFGQIHTIELHDLLLVESANGETVDPQI